MPVPALSITALTKRYDNGFLALDAFDLDVPDGAFFGLLGPNGAGKTTLISAVCNLIWLTDGEISVFGHHRGSMEARRRIGLPAGAISVFGHHGGSMEARRLIGIYEQEPNPDRFLTVREILIYHGVYYG